MTQQILKQTDSTIPLSIIGQRDFCRKAKTTLLSNGQNYTISDGNLIDAWSIILENKPEVILIEIGLTHNEDLQICLINLLKQINQRFGNRIFIIACSSASENFSFAGDLLFQNHETLCGSEFIDAMIFNPPQNIEEYTDINLQLKELMEPVSHEIKRRKNGYTQLPKLNNEDWIQSQADPGSRELWMRWIPRYAEYNNESPLIIGETGSGKTKAAYALHKLSGRKGKFISITPRDFSSSELVQAELFGAVAGAYTGAVDKWGLVKSAEKGTLFIDELQSIDKDLQGKLITFIENKTYRRVGSAESIEADVRFIFASNQSIDEMIQSNILREDFAYRLERVQLNLLPLRNRRMDISAALAYSLSKIHRQRPNSGKIRGYTGNAYRLLFCHNWPGNLRQLENSVAKLCDLAEMDNKKLIDETHVIKVLGSKLNLNSISASDIIAQAAGNIFEMAMHQNFSSIDQSLHAFGEAVRIKALTAAMGDFTRAADLINDNENSLRLTAKNVNFKNLNKD